MGDQQQSNPPMAKQDFVTIDTVGERHFLNSPIANRAVTARLTKDELIRILLDENDRLRKELIKTINSSVTFPYTPKSEYVDVPSDEADRAERGAVE